MEAALVFVGNINTTVEYICEGIGCCESCIISCFSFYAL